MSMVCRIHVVQEPEGCTVYLAGCLTAAQVTDLVRVCGDSSGSLRIDLTDLLSLDVAGFDALQRLTKGGAELVGVAQYLRNKVGPL